MEKRTNEHGKELSLFDMVNQADILKKKKIVE